MFWGSFCARVHFVSGAFVLSFFFFDWWLLARWLLSGGFLQWVFDRIPEPPYSFAKHPAPVSKEDSKVSNNLLPAPSNGVISDGNSHVTRNTTYTSFVSLKPVLLHRLRTRRRYLFFTPRFYGTTLHR